MSRSNIFERGCSWYRVATVFALLLVGMSTASAATRNITATFRPDPSNPTHNIFTNTTPPGGYCFVYSAQCAALGISSFFFLLHVTGSGPIQPNHPDTRQGAMFKVPADWRALQVINSNTGESEIVEVRISGIGGQYRTSDVVHLVGTGPANIAHGLLWGSNWAQAPSPCRSSGLGTYSNVTYYFFWHFPQEGLCTKQAKYLVPWMNYYDTSFAYELRTPNPLTMSSGRYTGSLSYGVGPGQDFDFGDVMVADDSVLTLNFNLEVDHPLKIEVPPGGNKVVLEPQGGWQAWLNQGRKPTRLYRDQTFHISTSSRFKMNLECQYATGGNTCSLWDADTGHLVPVEISVTLPPGLTDGSGQSVNRRRLYRGGSGTELFEPNQYLERKPGTLHFEIVREQVEEMLQGEGARTYTGNVTVIWDSEI